MKKIIRLSLALLLAMAGLIALVSLKDFTQAASDPVTALTTRERSVAVNGVGTIKIDPDIANISIGVISEAKTAKEAQAKNNTESQRVVRILRDLGIAEDDIKTSRYNIYPRYDYGKDERKLIGYEATHTLIVVIRDLDQLSVVLDKAVEAGVNNINNVNYRLENKKVAIDKARVLAAEDAKEKATKLGKAFGFEVGDLVKVSEHTNNGIVYRAMDNSMEMLKAGGGSAIQPGLIEVTVNLEVEFGIE